MANQPYSADSLVTDILQIHSRLEVSRSNFSNHWQEVAERVWPERGSFTSTFSPGEKKAGKIFDATATLALPRFAAAMESLLTPRSSKWHYLRPSDPDLAEDDGVMAYLERVNDILFAKRYSAKANFQAQMQEAYMSLGAFGTASLEINDMPGYGLRYKSSHLAELFFLENAAGAVDTVHRKFSFSAKQVVDQFGAKGTLPDGFAEQAGKDPEKRFDILHCVRPSGSGWDSYYILVDKKTLLDSGRYYSFPYAIGRYITTPNETYGRSPAMLVLPDIKTVNEMSKTMLRAAQMQVTPPLLLSEDGCLQSFNLSPGALNFGGVSPNGQALVQPLQTGGQFDVGKIEQTERRKVINDAFLISLFQILVDKPYMTASEAMLRAQEKGQLLAPTMGRIQSEMLGTLIEREIDILARRQELPPMPEELANAGGLFSVEFDAPLNRMMKAEEAVAIQRTLEAVTPLAQIDPKILQKFDLDKTFDIMAAANGVPRRALRSDDEMAEIRDADAQQAQAAQLMEAAPIVAKSAKDLATAQKTATEAGLPGAAGV